MPLFPGERAIREYNVQPIIRIYIAKLHGKIQIKVLAWVDRRDNRSSHYSSKTTSTIFETTESSSYSINAEQIKLRIPLNYQIDNTRKKLARTLLPHQEA